MCKRDVLTCVNIIGIVFSILAIGAAVTALIMDQLTWFIDDDGEAVSFCGWDATRCNDDYDGIGGCVSAFENDYEDLCNNDNVYCDAEEQGLFWLVCNCAGILLCCINIGLLLCLMKRTSSVFGIVAAIAFGLAVTFWAGFDIENFDFKGNELCYDHDDLDDEDIFPGISMFLVMGSSLFALIGAILSCAD